ncbi:MAG: alkene reductase [Cyanobacteria bacterium J06631_9]
MAPQSNVPFLLKPYEMGDLSLNNRVVMPPMTRGRADEKGVPTDIMVKYYTQRANAGLIISEGTAPSSQGVGWYRAPGIFNKEQTEAWKPVTAALREQGTPFFVQLWHTGRASHSSYHKNGQLPVAPSAIKIEGGEAYTPTGKQPHEVPRALETEEISGVVEDYRKAAENAKVAGFDGVEIHGANGYLIDEFLQSKTNQRTDKYGGSIENRYRFLKEIVEAVLTVWPANRVGVRIAPNGAFNDMGSPDYRETFTYVAEQLNAYNLAYLHVMDGLAFGFHELGEPMTLAEFRKVYKGTIIGNCGYDRESANAAIQAGDADLIAIGRPYISTPDLVARFENNWDLNPEAPQETWYTPGEEGYTDYPTYSEATVTA